VNFSMVFLSVSPPVPSHGLPIERHLHLAPSHRFPADPSNFLAPSNGSPHEPRILLSAYSSACFQFTSIFGLLPVVQFILHRAESISCTVTKNDQQQVCSLILAVRPPRLQLLAPRSLVRFFASYLCAR
jgi:hypothetical protein